MGIILASQSPRRKELLELAGIEHRVIVSQVDEILDEDTIEENKKTVTDLGSVNMNYCRIVK